MAISYWRHAMLCHPWYARSTFSLTDLQRGYYCFPFNTLINRGSDNVFQVIQPVKNGFRVIPSLSASKASNINQCNFAIKWDNWLGVISQMMLKLKLQYFDHLMWRVDSLEKTLMLGGIDGRRRRDDRGWDGWMASLTRWTRVWVNSGCWWWTGRLVCCDSWGRKELNTNWTELNWWPSNPTAGHAHRGNQNGKRHVYSYVHRSTVYNSQYTEAT